MHPKSIDAKGSKAKKGVNESREIDPSTP